MSKRLIGAFALSGLVACASAPSNDETPGESVDASSSGDASSSTDASSQDSAAHPAQDGAAATVDASQRDAAVIDSGVATGPDGSSITEGGATCPSPIAADTLVTQRLACAFHAGDHGLTTLGLGQAARAAIPIKHIVVIMKENRAFDHMLGALKQFQPDADVADATFTNNDKSGTAVAPFHLPSTCVGYDPDHQWNAMHAQVNGGKMDGFVTSAAATTSGDGHFVMGYYDEKDLPFYYFLATTYSIADRYFASARTGTFPNRDYLLLGTSDKVTSTQYTTWPDPTLPTIFDELKAAGISWGVYGDDHPLEETLNNPAKNWEKLNTWSPVSKLIDDFKNDTVPSVVFVDGTENVQDEHPTANVQVGEAWTKQIYDAAVASPAWASTALFLTYDEAGGFADHVPPSDAACLARPQDSAFHELGARVPFMAISPWARRHHVSHTQKEHASITRFIEAVFDLPAMTARDANADALLDMFDFGCPPSTIPAAPAAGVNGCGGNATLTLDKTSFASGEAINVHFAWGPANPQDWIAVYPRNSAVQQGSTLWDFCASGNHTAPGTGIGSGLVTLNASSVNNASAWPLAPGSSWTAYYLVNNGYTSIASVQFDIHN